MIGYYVALECVVHLPPLAMVLSEEGIQFILFPFQNGDDDLINALALSQCEIWGGKSRLDWDVLAMVLLMVSTALSGMDRIDYNYDNFARKKLLLDVILTDNGSRNDEMKRLQQAHQEALVKKDQALAKKDQALAKKDQALAEKDQALAKKDQALEAAEKKVQELEALMGKGPRAE